MSAERERNADMWLMLAVIEEMGRRDRLRLGLADQRRTTEDMRATLASLRAENDALEVELIADA